METKIAVPPVRRMPVDLLADAIARDRRRQTGKKRDWSLRSRNAALSLIVHIIVVIGLGFYVRPNVRGELAEPVVVEANLDAVVTLFDNLDEGIDSRLIAEPLADSSALLDAPLKMVAPSAESPNLKALDPGSKAASTGVGKATDGMSEGGAGGAPTGLSGGGASEASLLGLTAKGKRIVFIVDRSASMLKNNAIDFAKDELIRSIKSLRDNMEFQIVYYSDEAHSLPVEGRRRDLWRSNEMNRDQAAKFVRDMPAEGGTMHMKAIELAFRFRPDVVYLMTDADDDSEDDIRRLNKRLDALNRGSDGFDRASVHVIQLWHREDQEPNRAIRMLADQNRGAYKLIETYKESRSP